MLADFPAVEEKFEALLTEYGYIDIAEFERPVFLPGGVQIFEVAGDFPRLEPEAVPDGVCNLRFDVDLTRCRRFETDTGTLKNILENESGQ